MKGNRSVYGIAMICFVLLFKTSVAQHQYEKDTTDLLTVEGMVEHPLRLRSDHVSGFKIYQLPAIRIISLNGTMKKQFSARGILLKDVLDSASVRAGSNKEKGRYMIRLVAKDAYTVLFSWSELYNTPVGDSVCLLFDGDKRILENDGPWMLVSLRDKVTGPRYVKWLQKIIIEKE